MQEGLLACQAAAADVLESRAVASRRKLDPAVREALRALGRIGGKKGGPKGGKARWEGVSAEARRAHARRAAAVRWSKKRKSR
jgi:hypothetical protein